MAMQRLDSPSTITTPATTGAAVLAWALFIGGWVVLGALGRSATALWFAGLGPVAAWLAVAGAQTAFARGRPASRTVIAGAAVLAATGLAGCAWTGSGLAALAAAAGWGVLTCAAAQRAGAVHVPVCAIATASLADPARWPTFGARWAMLPMMASMAVASDWCASVGVTAGEGVALHVAAMLAPALLLRGLRSPLWVAAFMLAGLAALPLLPGVRGWMAMSLLHAVAWGIAWSQEIAASRDAPARRAAREPAWLAVAPAAGVLALGAMIAGFGLDGLVAVHVGLGALSLAGAAGWIIVVAWRHAHAQGARTPHKEMLS